MELFSSSGETDSIEHHDLGRRDETTALLTPICNHHLHQPSSSYTVCDADTRSDVCDRIGTIKSLLGNNASIDEDNDGGGDDGSGGKCESITYMQLLIRNSNFRFFWLSYVANHTVRRALDISRSRRRRV